MNKLIKNDNNEALYLRAFEMEDEAKLISIREKSDAFNLTTGNKYYSSKEHSKKLLSENLFSDGKSLYLMICLVKNDLPIGYISIINIDQINKKAQWGGIIIDYSYSGQGYATLSGRKMLEYAFEELNMNKIYGYWLDSNKSSLRIGEKLGFVEEGYIRDYVFKSN